MTETRADIQRLPTPDVVRSEQAGPAAIDCRSGSNRASATQHGRNRSRDHIAIEPKASAPKIFQIEFDPFAVATVRSAGDLPETGDPWPDARDRAGEHSVFVAEFTPQHGAWSDNAHVTA